MVRHVTSPRKPWRASSRMLVRGLTRAMCCSQPVWIVERHVAGRQEHREEDADLQERPARWFWNAERRARAPSRCEHERHARCRRAQQTTQAERGRRGGRRRAARREQRTATVGERDRTTPARIGPTKSADPLTGREQQAVVEAGLDVADGAEARPKPAKAAPCRMANGTNQSSDVVGGEAAGRHERGERRRERDDEEHRHDQRAARTPPATRSDHRGCCAAPAPTRPAREVAAGRVLGGDGRRRAHRAASRCAATGGHRRTRRSPSAAATPMALRGRSPDQADDHLVRIPSIIQVIGLRSAIDLVTSPSCTRWGRTPTR